MKKSILTWLTSAILGLCAVVGSIVPMQASAQDAGYQEPALANIKNVILLIGDGMGPTHVRAGEIYEGKTSSINSMPHSAYSLTRSANSAITDSAAGGTAIATGVRTNNGYVGIDSSQEPLETIMDVAIRAGKRTGVVTTDVMSGATPMSFLAHSNDRNASGTLLASAAESGVNLFAAKAGDSTTAFENNGYTKIANVDDISASESDYIIGSYNLNANAPSQSAESNNVAFDRLVSESIEYLSKDEDGFVLMAEGARIDKESHNNNFSAMVKEMLAFDDAVETALEWAKGRNDTVVIVTADHETGGLSLEQDATSENIHYDSKHAWSSTNHTATNVYCNVYGVDVGYLRFSSKQMETELKNTDIFKMMETFVLGRQEVNVSVKKTATNGGTITINQTQFYVGQTIKIALEIKDGYLIKSLKINGKESLSLFNDGTLDYTIETDGVEIAPTYTLKPTEYTITYQDLGEQGTWKSTPEKVEKNKKLTVEIEAATGYEIEKVTFGKQEMKKVSDGKYEVSVQENGTVSVTFKKIETPQNTISLGCGSMLGGGFVTIALALGVVAMLKKKEQE